MTLEIQNLNVSYGRKNIIQNFNHVFQPRKFSIIVGPNGSGKSTLIKAIAGERLNKGYIYFNGKEQNKYKHWELASIRGIVPQSVEVGFPFTVREIVEIGLEASPMKYQKPNLWRDALEEVGLVGFENRYYMELSGGEKQRVQIARVRAQVWQPAEHNVTRWFILDEPVSALDIKHQIQVMNIARAFADAGGGVIAVMHDLNLSAMYGDEIILLNEGQIFDRGQAAQVISGRNLQDVYDAGWEVDLRRDLKTPFVLPHMLIKQQESDDSIGDRAQKYN